MATKKNPTDSKNPVGIVAILAIVLIFAILFGYDFQFSIGDWIRLIAQKR
jgi:hypothetical protein